MLLGTRMRPLSPPSEPVVPELPELFWNEPQKGSAAMTTSTKLKEISTESTPGKMGIFWVKILVNVQLEHGFIFSLFADVQFCLQQQKF